VTEKTQTPPESDPTARTDEPTPEAPSTPTNGAEGASGPQDAAEDFKPTPGELVVRDRDDVFRVMDRADEEQILEELQGNLLKTMLYSFSQGGSNVTDLSYAGVMEAIRQLNAHGHRIRIGRLEELTETVEDEETYYKAVVYAEDERTGMGQFGLAKQPKHKKRKGGKTERDPFAETIALNKAQRNALRPFVPEKWRQTLIAQYHGDTDRERKLKAGAGAEQLAELPPPLTDERAEALKAKARELYDELKQVSRQAVLPAQFHAYLTRAEHSHERLEEFIGYLCGKLEEAQAAAS
jgi:hypothetical protein